VRALSDEHIRCAVGRWSVLGQCGKRPLDPVDPARSGRWQPPFGPQSAQDGQPGGQVFPPRLVRWRSCASSRSTSCPAASATSTHRLRRPAGGHAFLCGCKGCREVVLTLRWFWRRSHRRWRYSGRDGTSQPGLAWSLDGIQAEANRDSDEQASLDKGVPTHDVTAPRRHPARPGCVPVDRRPRARRSDGMPGHPGPERIMTFLRSL